jgi:ribose transport system ATP-binding protein
VLDIKESGSGEGPAARTIGLVKRFGPRAVLSKVDLTVERHQVHALIGANGSGKSTLAKILAGYYQRDAGKVCIGNVEVPADTGVVGTAALGVRVVHQDLGLFDSVSVLENVAVGRGYIKNRFGLIDWQRTRLRVDEALRRVGLDDIDPGMLVDGLPTWRRVAVACARALYYGLDEVRLLILDEITAALPPGEVRLVLDLVRRLKSLGAGILYVTHRFEEVTEVTDKITVLRDGKVLVQVPTAEVTVRHLVEWVSGDKALGADRPTRKGQFGAPILELRSLSTHRLQDISLTVRAGEVCGVIGRAGCGKSALGRTIIGQEKVSGIYNYIRDRAATGAAMLLLSSSLEEIAEICDRAVCLTDGRLTHAIEGDALSVRNMEHLLVAELVESFSTGKRLS